MASAVGRLIAIDKETQDKTRPSTARVKMIPDLMEKLPKMMCLQYWTSRPRGLANIDQSIDDNNRDADANNNEIAMVEVIENNGDRVVATCVQDVLSITTGILSEKDPSLATIEDFDQANKVQQFEENLDQIFESSGTCDHDFTMKDNDDEVGLKYQAKDFLPVAPNYVN
ncbi:hypothetical protein KY290_019430 [Solanum tuberosum]|uniref:Polyprotein protein n=1 Tax=Solanum tuberosum TaxID=4113 RepID=A0ABQ7VJ74_SOLTU|nr:hypothetical protein KY284_018369 [Solanum tuberosum]KAH0704101.1 hypothetical protein KY285_018379 [Solanum tuberosum]KAH0763357.1 hypothetical protein KY290_019430 [Solanum tuberosum]